jgi:twitching motility two-component system response regulator PilG
MTDIRAVTSGGRLNQDDAAPAQLLFKADQAICGVGSPARTIYQMMMGQVTGRLTVCDPRESSVSWQVFFGEGRIHFATCTVGQFERSRYLQQHQKEAAAAHQSDYEFLRAQWQRGQLTLRQLRKFLVELTQDALVQILKLSQGVISFSQSLGLGPLLISVSVPELLAPLQNDLQAWRQTPEVLSPLQKAYIADREKLYRLCHISKPTFSRLQLVVACLEQELCLYQIAQQLSLPLREVLLFIRVLIRRGVVRMHPYLSPLVPQPAVTCIDRCPEIQRCIKAGLESIGYRVFGLTNPQHLWSSLEQHSPAMMLIDVDHFEGYGLMRTLSRTEKFGAVPMVALTEHQGLLGRFKARQLGASDCLSKPIQLPILSSVVQQLLPPLTRPARA